MKLSLKDNLKKFNLIIEGWAESLSNKYNEDILIFVGRMLQMAYPNEDISNHPLAEWIAKTSKALGEMPWSESNKTRNEQAFHIILNFVKENNNALEVINAIKSKSAKEALVYVKDEIEKAKKEMEDETSPEEELDEWFSDGLIEFIGRGPKGSVWVKPLRVEFFDIVQCGRGSGGSQEVGEFGIGCQRIHDGGFGAVGFDRSSHKDGQTFSLLTKASNGYYTSIMSFAGNLNANSFVGDAAQFKNKQIGAESALGWSSGEILNAFVDFLISNPYGKRIYKGESFHKNNRKFGALIKEENREILLKLLKSRPEIVEEYEQSLIELLGKETLISLKIKARELYNQNPKEFMKNLPVYLKTEKEESLKILSEINFENFIKEYGEDVIIENVNSILKSMDYTRFNELIKPFISYNKFLEKVDKDEIKELIRNFSEKAQNSTNTLPIINDLISSEKDFEAIMRNFGKGNIERGIRAFLLSLSTPRMSKHKNYIRKIEGVFSKIKEPRRDNDRNLIDSQNRIILSGETVYDEQGNVLDFGGNENRKREYIISRISYDEKEVEIKEGQLILDSKNIRNLLKQNKEKIVNVLGGGEEAEIKWLEYLVFYSSEQERAKELKSNSDEFINYYNDLYNSGKSDLPGILQFSKVLSKQNKIKMKSSNLSDGFDEFNSYVYNIDKAFLQDGKNVDKIIKYYMKKSNRTGNEKVIDGMAAYFYTLVVSNASPSIDVEPKLRTFTNLIQQKYSFSLEEILSFVITVLEILPENQLSVFKKFIEDKIKIGLGEKIKQEKDGYDMRTGISKPNQEISKKLARIEKIMSGNESLDENKIRKYIQNLLNSNFRIK